VEVYCRYEGVSFPLKRYLLFVICSLVVGLYGCDEA
jgi:hypothetical protein